MFLMLNITESYHFNVTTTHYSQCYDVVLIICKNSYMIVRGVIWISSK